MSPLSLLSTWIESFTLLSPQRHLAAYCHPSCSCTHDYTWEGRQKTDINNKQNSRKSRRISCTWHEKIDLENQGKSRSPRNNINDKKKGHNGKTNEKAAAANNGGSPFDRWQYKRLCLRLVLRFYLRLNSMPHREGKKKKRKRRVGTVLKQAETAIALSAYVCFRREEFHLPSRKSRRQCEKVPHPVFFPPPRHFQRRRKKNWVKELRK